MTDGNVEIQRMYSGKKMETWKEENEGRKNYYTIRQRDMTGGPRNANWGSPRGANTLPYLIEKT